MSSSIWTFCVCLLTCLLTVSVSEGPLNITAEPGQTVTLTCRVTTKNLVTVVEWRRPDLESGYVSFYRSGKLDPDKQHLSFKNRVQLKDKHLKDGDVSVILKNVTINDTGTYECYVAERGRRSQLIITINLTVTDSVKTVPPGEDVLLLCQGPRGADLIFVQWIRPDLKSEGFVFFFRDDRTYENYQVPSFRGRVELRDPQMKDGDVSVILKNVTIKDAGTYECHVRYEGRPEFIRIINLTVTDSGGDKDGGNKGGGNEDGGDKDVHVGLAVYVTVPVLLLVVVVVVVGGGFLIYRNRKGQTNQYLIQSPPQKANDEQQILNVPSCESLDHFSLMREPEQNQPS